jgi:hypothetical protein
MKKFILALSLLAVFGTANAQWHHYHRPYYGPTVVYRDNWVAPLIIGGIAGAVIANSKQPDTVVVQQPQSVIVERQPVIVQKQTVCSEWKEIQTSDGTIYRERSCTSN